MCAVKTNIAGTHGAGMMNINKAKPAERNMAVPSAARVNAVHKGRVDTRQNV